MFRWVKRKNGVFSHEIIGLRGAQSGRSTDSGYTHLHAEKLAEKMSKIPLERIRDTEQNQS